MIERGLVNGLILTVFLGFIFTCFQAYEYHHATFTIDGKFMAQHFIWPQVFMVFMLLLVQFS